MLMYGSWIETFVELHVNTIYAFLSKVINFARIRSHFLKKFHQHMPIWIKLLAFDNHLSHI